MNVIFNSFWLIHACWESVFCNGGRQGTTKLWKLLYLINILHTKLNTVNFSYVHTYGIQVMMVQWGHLLLSRLRHKKNESEENLKILCQSLVLNSCLSLARVWMCSASWFQYCLQETFKPQKMYERTNKARMNRKFVCRTPACYTVYSTQYWELYIHNNSNNTN